MLTTIYHLSEAHTFLTEPPPYDDRYQTKKCELQKNFEGGRGTCDQGCPTYPLSHTRYTENDPIRTWQRGMTYPMKWARNNHHGGFISIAILPIADMMNKEKQKRYSFYQGCWEQKRVRCRGGEACGTDNEIFERDITIPNVMPDGIYAFTFTWFGGLHFKKDFGKFPDYHSCAFIRIEGGNLDTTEGFQPFFDSGDEGNQAVSGRCHAAVDEPGICPITGCAGPRWPVQITVPKAFQGNQSPAKIMYSDFVDGIPAPSTSSVPSTSTVPPSGKRTPQPFNEDPNVRCIWTEFYCCPESCGRCGGSKCSSLEGGANNCCTNKIRKSGRICGRHPPPCMQTFS